MKTLIAASLLLALTTPVHAGPAARWDCGNGATASAYKGEFGVWIGHPDEDREDFPYSMRGSRHFDLKWDFRGSKDIVRLNGKLCKRTN